MVEVDFQTAVRFIASHSSQTEVVRWGMGSIVPKRRHKTGVRPGATTEELRKRRKYDRDGTK